MHLEGFRGATKKISVKFDPAKAVTVLFGENGSGKSTVIDAIDFACNQSFGSLDEKSLSGEKKHNHVGSLTNLAKAIPAVDVEAGSGTFSARLIKDKIVVTEKPTGSEKPVVSVLRRSQILQLIDATPAKRFDALRSFFLTPNWTTGETTVRQALKTRQDQFSQQTTRLDQATSTLRTLWVQQSSPDKSPENWAATVLASAKPSASDRMARIRSLDQLLTQFNLARAHLRLAASESNAASAAVNVARQQARDAEAVSVGASLDLVNLLEQASQYVKGHQSEGVCPVCVQAKDANELQKELSVRIAQFANLSAANLVIETREGTLRDKSAAASASAESLAKLSVSLIDAAFALQVDQPWIDAVSALTREITASSNSTEVEAARLASLEVGLQLLRDEVTATEKSQSLRDSLKLQIDAITPTRAKAKELEAVTTKLGIWLAAIEASRKEVLDGELATMSSDVSALYARIHPGEGASSFSFAMKANAVSSLEFDADFLGFKGKPVQAYFSESHLDTLGLCVFLAVAQRTAGKLAVVVLDDILTSVDASHIDRVMSVIDEVAQSVSQVIVATHYRLWRDKYRWARASASQTEVIEFGPWSLSSGIQVQAFQDALAELSALLTSSPLDRQVIASKGGIVLESMLDFLTLKFACALPRNARAEYTLGALADGIDKKLASLLRSEYLDTSTGSTRSHEIRPLIAAATSAQWIRNAVGCHYNPLDSHIPDSEVLQFASAVLQLASAMICEACRSMTDRDKTGSNLQCRCGALKLWPLARPKD